MTADTKRAAIPLTPCQSSRICAHGWDPDTETLALQFVKKGQDGNPERGPVYHYSGVTKAVYGDLCKAESIGRFFGQVISAKDDDGKLIYPYTRVDEPVPEDVQ